MISVGEYRLTQDLLMKTILLMRHAKSSWKTPGQADHDRPLNDRGRRDAVRMAERLKLASRSPDEVICSTARRARETWELMETMWHEIPPLKHAKRLYLASPTDILAVAATADSDAERLLLIGHNPGMENLIFRLAGIDEPVPTAAIACIELPIDSWSAVRGISNGQLVEFWYPKDGA